VSGPVGDHPRRVAIVGGGASGLGAAWALHRHADRFDFRLYEAQGKIGGNAVTVDMPQGTESRRETVVSAPRIRRAPCR
jgi:predicted NAD/FAD-binding protein